MTVRAQSTISALTALLVLIFCAAFERSQSQPPADSKQSRDEASTTVQNKRTERLYSGEQGEQHSEIKFAPLTRIVTAKIHIEDPNGYFLPNLRPENFVVYEDGVRQKNVDVDIERAPATVALVLEFGGRYHELNKRLGLEVPQIGHQFLEVAGHNDKIAIFKYADKLDSLADSNADHDSVGKVFDTLNTPETSEANLYDSLIAALDLMRPIPDRKAIIVVSSGIDTFSKTNFDQLLEAARRSSVPIYAIGLGHLMDLEAVTYGDAAPFARINWTAAQKRLEALAKASGGRAYALQSDAQIPGIYDDIMENLRVRYVVTYVSSNTATAGPPRSIRIGLIDPKTGEPLKIHDAAGRLIPAQIFVQQAYSPSPTSG